MRRQPAACLLGALLALTPPALAPVLVAAARAEPPAARPPQRVDLADTAPPHPLPPPSVTHHTLTLHGQLLHIRATVGAVRLSDAASGTPVADVATTAFELEGADPASRPLTVAVNGGPGAASAWLDIGGVGPWRLPVPAQGASSSALPAVVDNADTWLDFTDLLFVDPVGTGYSRALGSGDAAKSFESVDGDIGSLATVVRKWLVAGGRLASPKFILGESYGGFRAPKLARKLEESDGIGVAGLVMVSPVLDFSWFWGDSNPAVTAAHLPSLVAAARHLGGPDPRAHLAAAESYASNDYLVDLYRGRRDPAAVARMSAAVAGFTGLDLRFVERLGGRVDAAALTREVNRDVGRIASPYDSNVTGLDPEPFDSFSHHADPVLDALKAPMATTMAAITAGRLGWPVQARYEILNMGVNARWDWGNARRVPEAMGDLARLLALDPRFRAVVMHGVTDQVTPYYASKLLIDQLPAYGDAGRLRLAVYGGGHMPYLDDASRAAMHEDARRLVAGEGDGAQR